MSPSESAQRPRLVVDRYGDMDMVSINFILPAGTLKGAGSREIADEIRALINIQGLGVGCVTHHHPESWQQVTGGE